MADIQGIELLTIVQSEPDKRGNFRKVRLVHWIVDGEPKSVKLEKRVFYKDEYGALKTGRADGFALKDLEACKPHWAKIIQLMKNPPAVVKQEVTKEDVKALDDVPF